MRRDASARRRGGNDTIAPRLGLPRLPVVDRPEDDAPAPRGLHWKTRPLSERAGQHPFARLDDEIGPVDRLRTGSAHPVPALLLRAGPPRGLTEEDVAVTGEWLRRRSPR